MIRTQVVRSVLTLTIAAAATVFAVGCSQSIDGDLEQSEQELLDSEIADIGADGKPVVEHRFMHTGAHPTSNVAPRAESWWRHDEASGPHPDPWASSEPAPPTSSSSSSSSGNSK